MKSHLTIFLFVTSLLLIASTANAAVFSSDSAGKEKNTFFTNDTIYVYANESITSSSSSVDIYIVSNSDSWANGTILNPVIPIISATTNSTGHIPITSIWSPDTNVGTYDIVIDANNDGIYNHSIDFVDNETSLGFEILEAPKPSITFSLGEKTPPDHSWDFGNNSQSVMMQLKIDVGVVGDVIINSLDFIGSGTGNDNSGISIIRLFIDTNVNGELDSGDELIAFGKFPTDDGVYQATPQEELILKANATTHLIITYVISNSVANDDIFAFESISASVSGKSGEKVIVSGLPLKSAIKTIRGGPPASNESKTMECSSYLNETSCSTESCRWCASENACKAVDEECLVPCTGNLSLSIPQDDLTTAIISGLENCDGKIVLIKQNSCEEDTIASCDITDGGCSANLPALQDGAYEIYVCFDFNDDNVFESAEQYSRLVLIQQQSQAQQTTTQEAETPAEFNYFFLIIPLAIIIVVAILVYVFLRKKKDKYDELKEKWKNIPKKNY